MCRLKIVDGKFVNVILFGRTFTTEIEIYTGPPLRTYFLRT